MSDSGQYLALPHAASLARNRLVTNPAGVYDSQHLSEMLNAVASALAKVVPVYVAEPGAAPRELTQAELADAKVNSGATLLALSDGRQLSAVSIRRADLRQAIAVLKAAGVPGITSAPPPEESAGSVAPRRQGELLARLAELEELLSNSLPPPQIAKADRLAMAMARNATKGVVANLAMKVMSALHDAGGDWQSEHLRAALQELHRAVDEHEKVT